jgi:SAM-dependent methyltransferase
MNMNEEKRKYIVELRRNEIDKYNKHDDYNEFVVFLDDHSPYSDHYYRYCMTFFLMCEYGLDIKDKIVIETGHPSPITLFLQRKAKAATETKGDLRYAIELDDGAADVVLSFEVMEHIKDQTEKTFDDVVLFNCSGVRQFASEIARVLRPGGLLFMTTPNAASLYAVREGLCGRPPMLFRPHVREYSRQEVEQIFSGLHCEEYTSHYSLFYLSKSQREPVLNDVFTSRGFSAEDRGELHFFKFRKPL